MGTLRREQADAVHSFAFGAPHSKGTWHIEEYGRGLDTISRSSQRGLGTSFSGEEGVKGDLVSPICIISVLGESILIRSVGSQLGLGGEREAEN